MVKMYQSFRDHKILPTINLIYTCNQLFPYLFGPGRTELVYFDLIALPWLKTCLFYLFCASKSVGSAQLHAPIPAKGDSHRETEMKSEIKKPRRRKLAKPPPELRGSSQTIMRCPMKPQNPEIITIVPNFID